jgi:hypothetical protein
VLIAHGRADLVAAGEPSPTAAQSIAAGLHAAARLDQLDPVSLTADEARTLTRMALFDLGPEPGVDEATKRAVAARLLAAIERYDGESTAGFERRFYACRDDLIRGISKQRKGGGPIPRLAVRQALLELVWDAHRYVGDCVGLMMAAFLRVLPAPLTAGDRAAFEALYLGHPRLGGLPLVMLQARFVLFRGAILDVLDEPGDDDCVGVLLRMLQFYAEMAAARRDADRVRKRRGSDRGNGATRPGPSGRDPGASEGPEAAGNRHFLRIVDGARRSRGISCACDEGGIWKASLLDCDEGVGNELRIGLECPGCGHEEELMLGRGEFERIGRQLGTPTPADSPPS